MAAVFADAGDSESGGGGESTEVVSGSESSTTAAEASSGGQADPDALAAQEAADAELAKEIGFSRLRADGKENRIPHSAVVRIANTREHKVLNELATALGLDVKDLVGADGKGKLALKSLTPLVQKMVEERKGRDTKYGELETVSQHFSRVQEIAASNGEGYIRALAQMHPEQYGRFVEFLDGKHAAPQAAQAAPQQTTFEMPQPDFDLGDGRKTYTPESLQQALQWAVQEGVRQAEAKIEGRIGPYEQQQKAAQQKAAITSSAQQKAQQAWAAAEKWPEFDGDAVLAELKADKQVSLEGAYYRSREKKGAAKSTELEQKLVNQRAEILKELQKAPSATSAGATGGGGGSKAASEGGSPKSTRDIVASQMLGKR